MAVMLPFAINAEATQVNAIKTSSRVLVDRTSKSFDAYNINDNNYFKLRDIAYVLNGTAKQFAVGWDGVKNAISLTTAKPYLSVGGEMTSSTGSNIKTATPTTAKIFLNSKEVFLTAYNIDGNNYFKLRDLGESLNFGVDWNASLNTIEISSTKGYTPEQVATDQTVCTTGVCIDDSLKNNGLVRVGYKGTSTEKVKLLISKDGNQYFYPIKPDGIMVGFPLQMGNGDYKVSVLSNVTGNTYAYVKTSNISIQLANPNAVYLNSIQTISWSPTSAAALKNRSLIGLETDYTKRITLGYNFVVQNVRYDFAKISSLTPDYIPIPDQTLQVLKGICYDYSSLFAAMKRSEGVPIKLVKGYSTLVEGYHAWNEVYINGKWIVVDTTVDAAFYNAKGTFSFAKSTVDYTKVYEY
jgi:hypothetical protein